MQFRKHRNTSVLSVKVPDHRYNPLKIPPDWSIAEKHALAWRVGLDIKND